VDRCVGTTFTASFSPVGCSCVKAVPQRLILRGTYVDIYVIMKREGGSMRRPGCSDGSARTCDVFFQTSTSFFWFGFLLPTSYSFAVHTILLLFYRTTNKKNDAYHVDCRTLSVGFPDGMFIPSLCSGSLFFSAINSSCKRLQNNTTK
jgi:hypothetical protein